MATRRIKDAKDLSTNELIYFKSHAKATFMSDGSTVEDTINNINLLDYIKKNELSLVATTGSFNDLIDAPSIPQAVFETTVANWGFTKNTGTYSKPTGGIPKSDLHTSIQDSLSKADTALQSETYKGTVTGVKINGSTKTQSNGIVDLGTVITSHQSLSGKQDLLVSGTNIKTINGQSILGNGNLVISGGASSGSSDSSPAYPEINHGTTNTTFTLNSNTFYIWDEVVSLTLSLNDPISGITNEYIFQFSSGETAPSLTLPAYVKWVNDEIPVFDSNKVYQISILNNFASCLQFPRVIIKTLELFNGNYKVASIQYEDGMTWRQFVTSSYNDGSFTVSGNSVDINNWYSIQCNGSYSIADIIISDKDTYKVYSA